MKKAKNKKLKKQFKKLLQNQLANHLKTNAEIPEKKEILKEKKNPTESTSVLLVKKDLKRTFLITATIISFMILLYLYSSKNPEIISKISRFLFKIIGG